MHHAPTIVAVLDAVTVAFPLCTIIKLIKSQTGCSHCLFPVYYNQVIQVPNGLTEEQR